MKTFRLLQAALLLAGAASAQITTARPYAISNTSTLGRVVIFKDADFRGGAPGSYTPRARR